MQDDPSAPVLYTPGPWVAFARGGLVLLADLDPASPIVRACWDAVEHGADLDALLGVIVREGLRSVPSFAIAAPDGPGVRVLVSGKARAEIGVEGGPPVSLSAAEAPTWVERRVEHADGVRLAAADLADAVATLPLGRGVVLAGSAVLGTLPAAVVEPDDPAVAAGSTIRMPVATPAAPEPAATPPADRAPAAAQPPAEATQIWKLSEAEPSNSDTGDGTATEIIESLPWQRSQQPPAAPAAPAYVEPAPQPVAPSVAAPSEPAAAPMVLATACPNRHLGPPHASTCRVCGAPVAQQEPFSVPRPPLGVLHLSTGDMVPLDRGVVLGRAPSADPDAGPQDRPHLVQLASPGNDISRNHLRVDLAGWHVQLVDLGSTNGTIVTLPGQQPVRLRPHDAFTIVPGTEVSIADEVHARFEVTT